MTVISVALQVPNQNFIKSIIFTLWGEERFWGGSLVGGTGVMQDRVIIGIIKVSKIPRPSITAPINLSDFFGTPNSDYSFSFSQPAITCSKLTIKTLEQGVKHVQS